MQNKCEQWNSVLFRFGQWIWLAFSWQHHEHTDNYLNINTNQKCSLSKCIHILMYWLGAKLYDISQHWWLKCKHRENVFELRWWWWNLNWKQIKCHTNGREKKWRKRKFLNRNNKKRKWFLIRKCAKWYALPLKYQSLIVCTQLLLKCPMLILIYCLNLNPNFYRQ